MAVVATGVAVGVGVGAGVEVGVSGTGVSVDVGEGAGVGFSVGVGVGVGIEGGVQPPMGKRWSSQSQARTWGAWQAGSGQSVPNSSVTVSPGSTQALDQRMSMDV